MPEIGRISSYGVLFGNLQTLRTQQTQFLQKSDQLSTGRQHNTIGGYREDAVLLLSFRREVERNQNILDRLAFVETVLTTADTAFEDIDEKIDVMLTRVEDSSGFDSDTSPFLYQQWVLENTEFIDNLLRDVTDLLNTRVGNRHIFAGSRYRTPPVRNLAELDLTAGSLNALFGPIVTTAVDFASIGTDEFNVEADRGAGTYPLPIYDSAQALAVPVTDDPRAWDRQLFHTGETASLSYGITTSELPIQRFIYALFSFKTALSRPVQAERQSFLNQAEDLFIQVKDELQTVREREALNIQELIQVRDDVEAQKQIQNNFASQLTEVNIEEVSVELSALRSQIEATYRTIQLRDSLSLTNILFT